MQHIEHPFPPVVDENCNILILGSFPSVKSRVNGFFYGHPRNRFWKVLAAVFNEEAPVDIAAKKAFLLRHHIAIWDVISSCDIEGSSDASVKNAVPVDITHITSVARIGCIICNGSLAQKLYQRHLQPIVGLNAIVMPSTSPANAAWSLDRLTATWRSAIQNTL